MRDSLMGVVVLAHASGLAGCRGREKTAAQKSLCERLGGEPAVKAVVADFVGRTAINPKANFSRKAVDGDAEWKPAPADVERLKVLLVQFVASAAGGPQKYDGRSMKESHKGMKITMTQFNAVANDLAASLDKFKVPAKEKAELLTAVASASKDMVEVP